MKFEIEKLDNYTIMPNDFIRDKKISLKAKGLLATFYSLPDNWDYSIKGLCTITKTGITAIRNIICELEIYGYIERIQTRTEKGTYNYIYKIYLKSKGIQPKKSIAIKRALERNNHI